MTTKRNLESSEFESFVRRFSSMPVTRVWFGDHLALYLELGRALDNYKHSDRSKHERHIFAGYDWSITSPDTKTLRSELTESRVQEMLEHSLVRSVTLDDNNELLIQFTGGYSLRTSAAELPEWCLHEAPDRYVSFEDGSAVIESEAVP